MVAGGSPSGTVTFLFTDIEGSTRLWEEHADEMETALQRHDALLRAAIEENGGYVFGLAGDSFSAVFQDHDDAAAAAIEAQQSLAEEGWPGPTPIRVRMGLHVGNAQERDGDYFGPTLNLAARVMSAGHGGQILLTSAANELLGSVETLFLGAHRLKDLSAAQEIFQVILPGGANEFPPLRTLDVVDHNLPVATHPIIGRGDDVDSVTALLGTSRLVTVVGAGGIGKTRLVLEVAARLADAYPDGVWLCELAPLDEPGTVADSVAQVLGARERAGHSLVGSIAEFCRRRRLLIVLDNCEHLLDAAADLAETVLAMAPEVGILATSREGLAATHEVTYPLRSLETAGRNNPAGQLFLRRAADADPSRTWSSEDLAAIGRICDRLDGIPLAIELAATRTRTQAPIEIEERLDEALRSLRGGRRSVERHRTLQAAIDWSFTALTTPQQMLFRRMAVFAGSCDLPAIEAVCADAQLPAAGILDLVDDLVTKSLVVAEPGGTGRTRYRLLEPLRQYAEDRLATGDDAEAIRDRYVDHYAQWAEGWRDALYGPAEHLGQALELDFANVRSAFFRALDRHDTDRACRIVGAFEVAQSTWRRLEVGSWAARVLETPGAVNHPLGPQVASIAAIWCWWRDAIEEGREHVALIEQMDHWDATAAAGNIMRVIFARQAGELARAEEILQRIDDESTIAAQVAVANQTESRIWGTGAPDAPATQTSRDAAETVQRLATQTGSTLLQINADSMIAGPMLLDRDLDGALMHYRRAIAAAQSIGAIYWVHYNLIWLGLAANGAGDVRADDLRLMSAGLRAQRDTGDELDQWLILVGAALALNAYVGPELAADVQHGIQSSSWAHGLPGQLIPLSIPDITPETPPSGSPVELSALVDRVIEAIDHVLANWDTATSSTRPTE